MTWQNILEWGDKINLGDGVANFILGVALENILGGGMAKFLYNSVSLVQFQHLCVTFLHFYICGCLPNESPL